MSLRKVIAFKSMKSIDVFNSFKNKVTGVEVYVENLVKNVRPVSLPLAERRNMITRRMPEVSGVLLI